MSKAITAGGCVCCRENWPEQKADLLTQLEALPSLEYFEIIHYFGQEPAEESFGCESALEMQGKGKKRVTLFDFHSPKLKP